MNSQMLCLKLGNGYRQKRREKKNGVRQVSGVEVVAYILVEEVCVLPYSSVTSDEVAGQEHCGPWKRKARVSGLNW